MKMTKSILKFIIKIESDYHKSENREKISYTITKIGIFLNILLAILKFGIAIFTRSISVLADAVNNLFDSLNSIISFLGFKLSNRPADKNHPYGYGRIEYISGLFISFIIIVIGFEFLKSSLNRIINPEQIEYSLLSIILILLTIITKIWMAKLYGDTSKIINSTTLKVMSVDYMGDVLTSIVVLIPLITVKFTTFPIDGYIGILVSLFIVRNAFKMIRESVSPLLGESPDSDLVKEIKREVESFPDIKNAHDIQVHNYGVDRGAVSLDVEVPADKTIVELHHIIEKAQRRVTEKFDLDCIIHMDPIGDYTDEEIRVLEKIQDLMRFNKKYKEIFDFRIVVENGDKYAYIDMLVNSNQPDIDILESELRNYLNEISDEMIWKIKIMIDY